jgi:hypothetical protein
VEREGEAGGGIKRAEAKVRDASGRRCAVASRRTTKQLEHRCRARESIQQKCWCRAVYALHIGLVFLLDGAVWAVLIEVCGPHSMYKKPSMGRAR